MKHIKEKPSQWIVSMLKYEFIIIYVCVCCPDLCSAVCSRNEFLTYDWSRMTADESSKNTEPLSRLLF